MKLYSDVRTKETYLEFWGASTKHPDVVFKLSTALKNGDVLQSPIVDNIDYTVIQWVIWCFSTLSFGTLRHTRNFLNMLDGIEDYNHYFA